MLPLLPPNQQLESRIDERDRTILSTLRKNGRISFKELGAKVNLSPNAAAERVNRLIATGVIRGFMAIIDQRAFGLGLQAFIDVKLQNGTSMEAFVKALRQISGVREATVLTGAFDARVRVDCTDPDHLGRLIEELREKIGVQETCSVVICRSFEL